MKLYLDDNSANPALMAMLRKGGHTVVCPGDIGMAGASDTRHLEHAVRGDLVVLTADRIDFRELHDLILAARGAHRGILMVRYENDPKRDMKPKHIVGAVAKLERAGVDLANQIVPLNQWR